MKLYEATEQAYKNGYQQGVKEVFDKLEEKLCVHTFTAKSDDYTDGAFDTMEWVDGKIDELKKEMGCGE